MVPRDAGLGVIGSLLALACAARLIHLDADPYVSTWIGYITDEGRWSETARNLALFGTPEVSEVGRLHLLLSPGYQAVNYLAFRLLGVDFGSARAFAAVSGIAIVLTAFFALRRHVTRFALALGIVILGFEANLLEQSRLALPETPSVLGSLLAFFVLVLWRKTPWNAFLAGVLAAAAVAMKGTSVLVMPAFPLIILLSQHGGTARARIARTLAFLGGFALPVAAGLGVGLALGLIDAKGMASAGGTFLEFLPRASPYTVVMRFFDSPELEARNLMLLGGWFCSWIWFQRQSSAPSVAGELYLMSGLWAAWWLLIWSGNDYVPGRYVVHFVVPATIHLMAGLSLAGRDTLARIGSALDERQGLARAALLTWLVLPSAILMTQVLGGLAERAGWEIARLSVRIALIMALTGLLAALSQRSRIGGRVVAGFLLSPIFITLLWLAGRELGLFRGSWVFNSGTVLAAWIALLGVTIAACFQLPLSPRVSRWQALVQSSVIALVATIALARGAPPIIAPTYSIRDASRNLERHFSPAAAIRSESAASLFLDNKLRYRELARDSTPYDGVVIFEQSRLSRAFFDTGGAANLVRVHTYQLTINPRYGLLTEANGKLGAASVAVYKPK